MLLADSFSNKEGIRASWLRLFHIEASWCSYRHGWRLWSQPAAVRYKRQACLHCTCKDLLVMVGKYSDWSKTTTHFHTTRTIRWCARCGPVKEYELHFYKKKA